MAPLRSGIVALAVLLIGAAAPLTAQGHRCPATGTGRLPLKYEGGPTVAAITPCDLMTRLYKYADDSMMGRAVGTEDHHRAVAYVEREVRRLGLKPAGDRGGYYQDFPIWEVGPSAASIVTVGGHTLRFGDDFLLSGNSAKQFANAGLVFGGMLTDTTMTFDSAAVAGKLLVLLPTPRLAPEAQRALVASATYRSFQAARRGALGILNVIPDSMLATYRGFFGRPQLTRNDPRESAGDARYPTLIVPVSGVEQILGAPVSTMRRNQVSANTLSSDLKMTISDAPAGRNVVAILPGTDPRLRGQYIAIGAHSDHIGFGQGSRGESDSLKVWGAIGHPAGAEGGRSTPLTADEWASINAGIREMRSVYPPRPDSISNGADDDGSGTVSVLEIAEAFAKGPVKPRRSILFVWHAGEERGMWGSDYFMAHPTVPRDSIVAQLNIDMVGRGAASDVTGQGKDGGILHGGPGYLQLVGSRRLSTELGDLVERVNTDKGLGLHFDYNIDANGHPQNIYCRSDHWSYAKWGVPVVFFTTGGHADYHQVTDEAQYIQYPHMAQVDSLIFNVALAAANLDHRLVVDHPKPDPMPATTCRQ